MREDQKETDHPLCPTTSLGLKISVSCLKPRVFVLTTPVLKVKMAQGVLYGLSCSPSENGNTCPELRFTTSLLEKGPWGLFPLWRLGGRWRCYFLKTPSTCCASPGTSLGLLYRH